MLLRCCRVILLWLLLPATTWAELHWHWESSFSEQQQARLKDWVSTTFASVENLVGPMPFDVHIYFKRRYFSREPVPWAHTIRDYRQGVVFNVDVGYSQQEFLDDWTAPHELSHLIFPYVGRRNAWFAEGLASYMQYQVMADMGVIDDAEKQAIINRRISRAERAFEVSGQFSDMTFTQSAKALVARREYPTMYWGGAAFFQSIDQKLQERSSSLVAVLKDYVECCRHEGNNFSGLIAQLDKLAGEPLFSQALKQVSTENGFPTIVLQDDSEK